MHCLFIRWLAALVAIIGVLSLPALAEGSLPLEKKYSLEGFERVNWNVLPESLADKQKLEEGVWSLANDGGEPMLLLAPYDERDLALTADIVFPGRDECGAVGVFVSYEYYEDVDWASYILLMIYPDGMYSIGHSQNGHMVRQRKGRFTLRRRTPQNVTLKLAKLNDRLFVVLNSYKTLIQVGVEPTPGGFGFQLLPHSRVELSNFELSVFGEIDYPFKGLDVIKFFTSGNR
jgi:hypothetical protein